MEHTHIYTHMLIHVYLYVYILTHMYICILLNSVEHGEYSVVKHKVNSGLSWNA